LTLFLQSIKTDRRKKKIPIKIKRAFEHQYGKKKGDRIFYSWENKKIAGINIKKPIYSPKLKRPQMKKLQLFKMNVRRK